MTLSPDTFTGIIHLLKNNSLKASMPTAACLFPPFEVTMPGKDTILIIITIITIIQVSFDILSCGVSHECLKLIQALTQT